MIANKKGEISVKSLRRFAAYALTLMMLVFAAACENGDPGTKTSGESTVDLTIPSQVPTDTSEPSNTTAAPTTTAAATEPRPFTPVQPGEIPVDYEGVYTSRAEGAQWTSYIYSFGPGNTGKQHVSFDLTPLQDKIDASVDFADYDVKVTNFQNLGLMVRLNTEGHIGYVNGASFDSVEKVYYTANQTYHVDVYANLSVKNYSVYITTPDGNRILAAENYSYRNSATAYTNDLGKMLIVSAPVGELLRVEHVKLEAGF